MESEQLKAGKKWIVEKLKDEMRLQSWALPPNRDGTDPISWEERDGKIYLIFLAGSEHRPLLPFLEGEIEAAGEAGIELRSLLAGRIRTLLKELPRENNTPPEYNGLPPK